MGNTDLNSRKRKKKNKAGLSRTAMKEKRRKARKQIVLLQRALIIVAGLAVIGGGFAVVWNLPAVKLNRQLDVGSEYTEEAAYPEAIEAYESALEIDSTSVKAYRCMAGAYLDMEAENEAKQILFEGWENTQDEGLLQYYCTVLLNEAVAEINSDSVTLKTADKVADVLGQGIMKEDALPLLGTVYERLMEKAGTEASFDFASYEQVMDKLFAAAEDGTEEIRAAAARFGLVDTAEVTVPMEHVEAYLQILEKANALQEDAGRTELIACLNKEKEIQEMFADIFTEFDAGNYEAAKDFIVTDAYTQLRDRFIDGTMEYWNGETYIPVSRERVILKQTEGSWTFEYPDFKADEDTAGIITVWGNPMKDNGVQRSGISYEPAKGAASYYPHTEYVVTYMYSNVQKKNAFVYEMNYHFETRTWTEEGMATVMIGDWGGPYQWEKEY